MKKIQASEFESRCEQILDDVAETREPVRIIKHGQPIGQITPYRPKPETLFAMSKDTVVIKGDMISPIEVEWEVLQ